MDPEECCQETEKLPFLEKLLWYWEGSIFPPHLEVGRIAYCLRTGKIPWELDVRQEVSIGEPPHLVQITNNRNIEEIITRIKANLETYGYSGVAIRDYLSTVDYPFISDRENSFILVWPKYTGNEGKYSIIRTIIRAPKGAFGDEDWDP